MSSDPAPASSTSTEQHSETHQGLEIDPKILADIGQLSLRARIVADSALAGMHRSKNHGSSVEFAEHKEYSPGDELRHLDWRAYARFDRYFIKRFEDESSLRVLLVLDCSGTMNYPAQTDERLTKLEFAKTIAGAFAFVLARQGDATGLALFSDRLNVSVPARARRGHLQELLNALSSVQASGPTHMGAALDSLSRGLAKRTTIILCTDLLDGGLEALPRLARLRARNHDVILFHVLDPDELEFPFEEGTLFNSLENEDHIRVDGREIRSAYLEEIARFRGQAETASRRARVEYHLARTDQAPGPLIARVLAHRARNRSISR
ncbi:MAG: DUF58 domain-containing protein [Myxococcales bacterium]|nr:DUF58 domain-containing protein [Myxococcales bacterium]